MLLVSHAWNVGRHDLLDCGIEVEHELKHRRRTLLRALLARFHDDDVPRMLMPFDGERYAQNNTCQWLFVQGHASKELVAKSDLL